jgi:hypothetical protein
MGPPSLLSNRLRRVKLPGCEAAHSPTTNAEVKNTWIYTSTPQYVFMSERMIWARDDESDGGGWSCARTGYDVMES